MLPRVLAALCAAALTALTVAVPAAHADQSFSGTIDGSEEWWGGYTFPDYPTQTCGPESTEHGDPLPADTVTFISEAAGPRRFVLRSSTDPKAFLGMWIYRNGVCVAADAQPGNPPEVDDAGELVIGGVDLAVDDVVVVKILGNIPLPGAWHGPVPWVLTVEQPGTASAVATGKATRYVSLPYQYGCVDRKALAQFTKKGRKAVKSVVVRASGTTVASTSKISRKPVKLKKIPAGTTSLEVVAKLKNGKKVKAARAYRAC
jgi:hypothetical protein